MTKRCCCYNQLPRFSLRFCHGSMLLEGCKVTNARTFILICEAVFRRYLPCSSLSDLYSLTLDGRIECLTLTIIASVCWVPISIAVGSQRTMSRVSVTKRCFCYNQLPRFSLRFCHGSMLLEGCKVTNARTFILICEAVFRRYLPCSSLSDLYSLTLDGRIECLTLTIIASVCWVPISIAVGSQRTMSHVSVTKRCFCYNQLPRFSLRFCHGSMLLEGCKVTNARTFILICEAVFRRYLPCLSLSDLYSLTLGGMTECLTPTILASVCWVPISIAVGSQVTMSHVGVKKTCSCHNQLPGFLSDLVMVACF